MQEKGEGRREGRTKGGRGVQRNSKGGGARLRGGANIEKSTVFV